MLLFDEYYTELYRFREAKQRMLNADKMVFIGTSFNVGITNMALQIAAEYNKLVEIVGPDPVAFSIGNITYKKMTAIDYIQKMG